MPTQELVISEISSGTNFRTPFFSFLRGPVINSRQKVSEKRLKSTFGQHVRVYGAQISPSCERSAIVLSMECHFATNRVQKAVGVAALALREKRLRPSKTVSFCAVTSPLVVETTRGKARQFCLGVSSAYTQFKAHNLL